MFSSRTRTVPQPRQMYLPAPGLSPALYGMNKRLAGGLIKVGRAGGGSVEGVCRRPAVLPRSGSFPGAAGTPAASALRAMIGEDVPTHVIGRINNDHLNDP